MAAFREHGDGHPVTVTGFGVPILEFQIILYIIDGVEGPVLSHIAVTAVGGDGFQQRLPLLLVQGRCHKLAVQQDLLDVGGKAGDLGLHDAQYLFGGAEQVGQNLTGFGIRKGVVVPAYLATVGKLVNDGEAGGKSGLHGVEIIHNHIVVADGKIIKYFCSSSASS